MKNLLKLNEAVAVILLNELNSTATFVLFTLNKIPLRYERNFFIHLY